MAVMKFRRFTKLAVLKEIGRGMLDRFFDQVGGGGNGKRLELSPASATDDEYFQAVARALMSPEGLPDVVSEALYMVDEMSGEEGYERLQAAAQGAGLKVDGHTRAELAVEVFLTDPKALSEAHSEQRLTRLTSFEYYGNRKPVDRTETFKPPTAAVLAAMCKSLDEWFAQHNRGKETVRVGVHLIDGEYFFIIRHGDTFTRTAKVNQQKTEMLHFRPERDDVGVYSPELDEIRIRAGTKGERELYRREFGLRLFGDPDYFSKKKAYTLDPLRADGPDALNVDGCGDLERAVLREYEVAFDNGFEEVVIRRATDVFAAAEARPVKADAIPKGGRLVRASFDLYFAGKKKPRKLQIRLPNALKLGRHCDVHAVQAWLSKRGFRAVVDDGQEAGAKRGWTLKVGERVIAEGRR